MKQLPYLTVDLDETIGTYFPKSEIGTPEKTLDNFEQSIDYASSQSIITREQSRILRYELDLLRNHHEELGLDLQRVTSYDSLTLALNIVRPQIKHMPKPEFKKVKTGDNISVLVLKLGIKKSFCY